MGVDWSGVNKAINENDKKNRTNRKPGQSLWNYLFKNDNSVSDDDDDHDGYGTRDPGIQPWHRD